MATMNCQEVAQSLPWLLDDELELELRGELERHLMQCASCQAMLQREGALRAAVQRSADAVHAPSGLRHRVRELVQRERRESAGVGRWFPAAAAAAILLAFAWNGVSGRRDEGELELVADRHARNLPLDVVAADVLPVQEYLRAQLPFAVRLPHLQTPTVRMGGRVTNLRNQDAAYVRYELPRGQLSMFVYENRRGDDFPEVSPLYRVGNQRVLLRQLRGYTVATWREGGLTYSMVTDIPERDVHAVLQSALR